jgi:aminopeptidase N
MTINSKVALRNTCKKFKNSNVETSDLRNIMEQVSGQNLEHFFKQWIYTEGHPELAIEFIENQKLLRITQLQRPSFEFKLDVKVAYSNGKSHKTFEFTIKPQEHNEFKIAQSDQKRNLNEIEWFSIDPDFKILKEIKSMKVPQLMILNQITNGNTIIERRQALDAIDYAQVSEQNLEDNLIRILKDKIINDGYFGVSTKAAGKLGQMNSKKALDALFGCIV